MLMRRSVPVLLAVLVLTISPWSVAAQSEQFLISLEQAAVVVELNDAHIKAVTDDAAAPSLQVTTDTHGCESSQLLELQETGDNLLVKRREPSAECGVRIELTLVPTQALAIHGGGLEVVIDGQPVREEADQTVALEQADRGMTELVLESSVLSMSGVREAVLVLVDSFFTAEGCSGSFDLDVGGGTTQINGHSGPLKVAAVGTELSISDSVGQCQLQLYGGTAMGRRSRGDLQGTADETRVFLDQWYGAITLESASSTVEVRSSGGKNLTLTGIDVAAVIERWEGVVNVTLDAGSLRGSELLELVKVTARGSEVELNNLAGSVRLELEDGAVGVVQRAQVSLQAVVDSSSLQVQQANLVTVQAADATITLAGITRAQRLDFTSCTVNLDLRELRQRQRVTLQGSSSATVRLSSPCQVLTPGSDSFFESNTHITGCEHLNGSRGRTTPRGFAGKRPAVLVVALDEASELAVTGD